MSPNYPKNIPEPQLVELLINKDKSAFEYLYDNYADSLYGIISKIVKDDDIAEEVLQDAFLKVWTKIIFYDRAKGRLFTWMLNLSRNLAIDKIRSKEYKKGAKTDQMDNNVYAFDRQNSIEQKTDQIGVLELMKDLSPEQKLVVDLLYFQGYTQSEVADEFDIPLGTVKTRLRSAIIHLRKSIKLN